MAIYLPSMVFSSLTCCVYPLTLAVSSPEDDIYLMEGDVSHTADYVYLPADIVFSD